MQADQCLPFLLPALALEANELSIVGNLVGTHAELDELVWLAAVGNVKLRTRCYPLDDINKAVEDLRSGRLAGRAIVLPS